MKLDCPHCSEQFHKQALCEHRCASNHFYQITKQELWEVEEAARAKAGLPERVYGCEVTIARQDGELKKFRVAGNETAARNKARLQRRFKEVVAIETFTYERYCRASGVPGMRM